VKYVLDMSAIIRLIQRLKDKSIDLLKECIKANLVYYEIGISFGGLKDTTHYLTFLRLIL